MEQTELTPQAKEAIRNYMLKLVTIPGVLLTILGFILGFLINDVAKQGAYNSAYEEASKLILNLTQETSAAALESRKSQEEAEQVLKEVESLLNEAESIRKQLRTAEAFQKSEELVKEVADTLIVREDFKGFLSRNLGEIHFFSSEEYQILWRDGKGGPHLTDVPDHVPENAKGVILRVIVLTERGTTGSFVCADADGKFSPKSTDIWHYQQNGFTNYTNQWVGGVVFCPLTKERAVKWQMMSNDSQIKSTQKVVSIGTLIGWF